MFEERWQKACGMASPMVQNKEELKWMYDRVKGLRSYLEVGTGFGQSLYVIAGALAKGARIVTVDYPKYRYRNAGYWAKRDLPHFRNIDGIVKGLREDGYEVSVIRANSRDPYIVGLVKKLGPYEACLIDGDHSMEGVTSDYKNYRDVCSAMFFHDVVNTREDASKWWASLDRDKEQCAVEYGMGLLK